MQGVKTTWFQKIQAADRFDDPDDGWSSALEEKEEEENNFEAQTKDVIPPTFNKVVIQIYEKDSVTSCDLFIWQPGLDSETVLPGWVLVFVIVHSVIGNWWWVIGDLVMWWKRCLKK